MIKQLFQSTLIFFLVSKLSAQQYDTFIDSQDKRVYNAVIIGSQVWMSENLNIDKFRNGDLIPEAKTVREWQAFNQAGKAAWCYYNNDTKNGEKYGKLYNWYAVNDPRGLAPKGWHISSDSEWKTLTNYLGVEIKGNTKIMRTESGWQGGGNGNNSSGFSGLPGGYRDYDGVFKNIGEGGYWWCSSERDKTSAWSYSLTYFPYIYRYIFSKTYGSSVRCLRD